MKARSLFAIGVFAYIAPACVANDPYGKPDDEEPLAEATSALVAAPYKAFDLGTLGGSYSNAFAINNQGQVAGFAATAQGFNHAFRTAPNSPINPATSDLGTLPGGTDSIAFGINDSGQVVGQSYSSSGSLHAFLYSGNGPMVDLGTLPGGHYSIATSINNQGQVVGYGDDASGAERAWSWKNGVMKVIPLLSGDNSNRANAVSNTGMVVGTSYYGNPNYAHGWRWVDGTSYPETLVPYGPSLLDLRPLGANAPAGGGSEVCGIMLGYDTQKKSFWWRDYQLIPIGDDWTASGINDLSQVVGYGWNLALLFSGGSLQDLGGLGGTSAQAKAINNQKQIAGNASTVANAMHAVRYDLGCLINGTAYANGSINPLNICQKCDISQSSSSWSNNGGYTVSTTCKQTHHCAGAGTACDGAPCTTNSQCTAYCQGGAQVCSSGEITVATD